MPRSRDIPGSGPNTLVVGGTHNVVFGVCGTQRCRTLYIPIYKGIQGRTWQRALHSRIRGICCVSTHALLADHRPASPVLLASPDRYAGVAAMHGEPMPGYPVVSWLHGVQEAYGGIACLWQSLYPSTDTPHVVCVHGTVVLHAYHLYAPCVW